MESSSQWIDVHRMYYTFTLLLILVHPTSDARCSDARIVHPALPDAV